METKNTSPTGGSAPTSNFFTRCLRRFRLSHGMVLCLASAVLSSSCSHLVARPGPRQSQQGNPAQPTGDVAGPPEPQAIQGPIAPQERKVVLILGPGMASALGGAGVIRAVREQQMEIAAIVGLEFGALVGAAYASSGTLPSMDWKLLQVRPEWLAPPGGLGAMFGSSKAKPKSLSDGLLKIFGDGDASSFRVPLWLNGSAGGATEFSPRGPIARRLVQTLSHPETMEDAGQGFSSPDWGDLIARLQQEGYSQPKLWVISTLGDGWPHAAAVRASREARNWVSPDDLVIELRPPQGDAPAWSFEQRSALIYQGRQAAKRLLTGWRDRLGWGSP